MVLHSPGACTPQQVRDFSTAFCTAERRLSTSLLGCRAVRVVAPMMATIVLGVLLCGAGGAQPAAVDRPPAQASAKALDRYLVLTRRALTLREERRSAELGLAVARRSLVRAERRLGDRLRALYVVGRPDAVEILLGASSLDDALTSLDGLQRIAREEAELVDDLRRTRRELARLVGSLRAREAEAARLRVDAARVIRELARTTPRLSTPPGGARAPETESQPSAGSLLTVIASGYAIAGQTASGLPAGVGTVAVDPAVIPLGAALTIPGYGDGVAADTGGAVQGAAIDLWFQTEAEARAWGRRAVTIVVRPG
jgi:3D (Asp-Asp-Asp) domain-containing protein